MTRTGGDTRTDPGPPLLFVNKDASNLSRTKAEAFAVGSHMSKAYRRWSKSQKLRNLRPTASVLQSTNVYLEIRRHPRKSLLEECDESEVAGSPQAVGAFLKLIIDRMKSTIPAKVSIYSHGYSPTIYRAMEYCTYPLLELRSHDRPRLIKASHASIGTKQLPSLQHFRSQQCQLRGK